LQVQATAAAQAQIAATNPSAVPTPVAPVYTPPPIMLARLTWDAALAFGIFGLAWGIFARMLLLRWKHGWKVGVILACLALTAIWIGVVVRRVDLSAAEQLEHPWPFHRGFIEMTLIGAGFIILGASIAWPVWVMLVKAFLPKRTSDALIEWQKALSINVSALARDPQAVQNVGGRSGEVA
jgi:vacuolar-type H+-ATPase subunit I/STV1